MKALQRQGIITSEPRGRRTLIYKLQFRVRGRQRVRYLGTDQQRVEQMRSALENLQAAHRGSRRLKRVEQEARALLRASRQRLETLLEPAGWKFHGGAIRRVRKRTSSVTLNNP